MAARKKLGLRQNSYSGDTLARTEQALLNIYGISPTAGGNDKESFIADTHKFLEGELQEVEEFGDEELKKSDVYLKICEKKKANERNSPESLNDILARTMILAYETLEKTNEDSIEDAMNDFDNLISLVQELAFFMANIPINDEATKVKYSEVFDKAGNEKDMLEFETYKAMGGEGTKDQFLEQVMARTNFTKF